MFPRTDDEIQLMLSMIGTTSSMWSSEWETCSAGRKSIGEGLDEDAAAPSWRPSGR
jgi:hypothetical protein